MELQLFVPLVVDQCCPEVGVDALRLLEEIGCNVSVPSEQTSSGEEIYNAGYHADAREVAEKFMKDFDPNETIVVPSAESKYFICERMEELFQNSSLHLRYKQFQENTEELSHFLVEKLAISNFNKTIEKKALVHMACAYGRVSDQTAMTKILEHIRGLDWTFSNQVCGWKESMYIDSESASKMAISVIDEAERNAAHLIVVEDPNCLVNLRNAATQKGSKVEIEYFASILV